MERDELLALGLDEEAADRIVSEMENVRESYEGQLSQMKKEYEIEAALVKNGAKNIRAVRALVNENEDILLQIESLKNSDETKFLFEAKNGSFVPHRSREKLPDKDRNEFETRLFQARSRKDTVEAIRIKQQAAAAGVVLI